MPPKSARGGKVVNSVRKTTTKKSAAINVGTLTFDPPDVSKLPVEQQALAALLTGSSCSNLTILSQNIGTFQTEVNSKFEDVTKEVKSVKRKLEEESEINNKRERGGIRRSLRKLTGTLPFWRRNFWS